MLEKERKYILEDALKESVKEVHSIQSGKLPKKSWRELKTEIQKDK